jgi:RNA recognition motif-containing protein
LPVSRNVYVGNLPASATEVALSNLFGEHGKVARVKMITDRGTGRSLGYAFVEMATPTEGARVIEALDGTAYDGWELTVRTATTNRR